MTNQDAIKILNPLFEQCKGKNECLGYIEHFFTKHEEEALDLAIKALESKDALDKIRIEIVQMPTISFNANDIYKVDVLAIIDKYKAESEEV